MWLPLPAGFLICFASRSLSQYRGGRKKGRESDDSESLRGGPGAPRGDRGCSVHRVHERGRGKQVGPWWQCHRLSGNGISLSSAPRLRTKSPGPQNFARVWWGGNPGIQAPRPSNPIESVCRRGHELGTRSVLHRPGGDPGLGNPYFPLALYYALVCVVIANLSYHHRAVVLHR